MFGIGRCEEVQSLQICVFAQHEVSSDEETSADDVHFPVSLTDSRTRPVVVVKRLDFAG